MAFSNERIYGGTLTTFPGVLRDDCLRHVVVRQDGRTGQETGSWPSTPSTLQEPEPANLPARPGYSHPAPRGYRK